MSGFYVLVSSFFSDEENTSIIHPNTIFWSVALLHRCFPYVWMLLYVPTFPKPLPIIADILRCSLLYCHSISVALLHTGYLSPRLPSARTLHRKDKLFLRKRVQTWYVSSHSHVLYRMKQEEGPVVFIRELHTEKSHCTAAPFKFRNYRTKRSEVFLWSSSSPSTRPHSTHHWAVHCMESGHLFRMGTYRKSIDQTWHNRR